jgi:hypothetical protein
MDVRFEKTEGKDEWLTPQYIIQALGVFDLDPCSPITRPWDTAKKHYTVLDDGLTKNWEGRVFCNPPYGAETGKWLKKCSQHENVIALVFARTETKSFFEHVWPKAYGVLFLKGRIKFYDVTGKESKNSAGAPSCLIAYNEDSFIDLMSCGLKGCLVRLRTDHGRTFEGEKTSHADYCLKSKDVGCSCGYLDYKLNQQQ